MNVMWWQGLEKKVARLEKRTRKGLDLETVHELRVACRRARATIALFKPLLPAGRARKLDRAARRTMRSLAELREDDAALAALQDGGPAPGRDWLATRIQKHRDRLARRDRKDVARHAQRLRERLAALRDVEPPANVSTFLEARLAERAHALRTCTADLDGADAARLHQMRIAVKRWRYGAELARETTENPDLVPLIAELRRLQEIGGRAQDAADLLARVRRQEKKQRRKGGPADELAAFAQQLEQLQVRTAEEFREALRASPLVASRRPALPPPRSRGDGARADA